MIQRASDLVSSDGTIVGSAIQHGLSSIRCIHTRFGPQVIQPNTFYVLTNCFQEVEIDVESSHAKDDIIKFGMLSELKVE